MIEIDGSLGEGGGQVLRSSLSLAAVLEREVRVFNIRAGRSEPGLKAQHLTGAKAIAKICNASFQGLEIGSTDLVFRPGRIQGGDFRFDVGTAGSITLVLQALMPLFPFAPKNISIELRGGTDVKWSPPIDYLRLVTVPILSKMGLAMSVELLARGHYPRGGGIVRVTGVPSGPLKPIEGFQRGQVDRIIGVSHAVKLPSHVAERQALGATGLIRTRALPAPDIEVQAVEDASTLSPGSGMVLSAACAEGAILGGDNLGERGRPAEEVGRAAAQTLVEDLQSGKFLDRHMGDMIVPYLALADGVSDVSLAQVTQHTLTNVRVAEQIAGVKFDTVGALGQPGRLRVAGVRFNPSTVFSFARAARPTVSS